MKNRLSYQLVTALLVAILIFLVKSFTWLPWWSFVVPIWALGIVISLRKGPVAGFPVGFITGFLIWSLTNLYYDTAINGHVLERISLLLSVHKTVVLLGAGVIGGLVTGLALHIGNSMLVHDQFDREKM